MMQDSWFLKTNNKDNMNNKARNSNNYIYMNSSCSNTSTSNVKKQTPTPTPSSSSTNSRKSYYFTSSPSPTTRTSRTTTNYYSCSSSKLESISPHVATIVGENSHLEMKFDKLNMECDHRHHFHLSPILTRPTKSSQSNKAERMFSNSKNDKYSRNMYSSIKNVEVEKKPKKEHKPMNTTCMITTRRKSTGTSKSPKIRVRVNSPKVAFRTKNGPSSSSPSPLSGMAILKTSFDPQSDFRESMMEMIAENNIRASKDLENLLACYLELNSDEYHHLIIKVFKQIWFDLVSDSTFK